MEREKYRGRVLWFNAKKNYGFIYCSELDREIFVHDSELDGVTLHKHDRVLFNIEKGERGPRAVRVQVVHGG